MKKLKLLDTFSGIGGFSYAAEKLVGGFETTQFIEIDPYCQKILKKHWPDVPIHDDITTYRAESYSADVICGGFPCQSISTAGKGEGITETSKSGMWFELIRTIRMVRPKYFILENVSAILANGLDIVLRDIYEAGYNAEWCCIPSSFVGACHQRDRWWLVAYPNCKQSSGTKSEIQAGRIFSSSSTRSEDVADSNSNGLQREVGSRVYRPTWKTQNTRRINPNWRQYESQPCLRRGDDGLRNRVDRLKALGNSVVPQVAAIPLQRVKDIHEQLTSVDR
jgi:DNA (cytosine-5)-methyltransferase 1